MRGRDDEGEPLVQPHVVADERGAHLVLLDRAQHAAERRMHQAPQRDQHEREQHAARNRTAPRCCAGRSAEAERAAAARLMLSRPSSPPVTRVPLDRDEPEHLAEGDGQQRVVDAAPVRDEAPRRAHRTAPRRATAPSSAEPEPGAGAQLQQAERVGADAEVRAVPERRQAGVPEQQVVAEREQHPDHDFQREVLVQADLRQPQRRAREQQRRVTTIGAVTSGAWRVAAGIEAGRRARWTD